jgi:GNAT superfamily N-acetyltransferase
MTERTAVTIASADPDCADARSLIAELGAELTRVTGHFTAWSYSPADAHTPRSTFVIARDITGQAVGCGAIRPIDAEHTEVAELKRMYARAGTNGVGHAILTHLEHRARELGYTEMWLETGVQNTRAIRFYERHGYRTIANFGPYTGRAEATCLGKQLRSLEDP